MRALTESYAGVVVGRHDMIRGHVCTFQNVFVLWHAAYVHTIDDLCALTIRFVCTDPRIVLTDFGFVCTDPRIVIIDSGFVCTDPRIVITDSGFVCTDPRIVRTDSGRLEIGIRQCHLVTRRRPSFRILTL